MHVLYAVHPPQMVLLKMLIWRMRRTFTIGTFPRAINALGDDNATITALHTIAYALKGAAVKVMPIKWGGALVKSLVHLIKRFCLFQIISHSTLPITRFMHTMTRICLRLSERYENSKGQQGENTPRSCQ